MATSPHEQGLSKRSRHASPLKHHGSPSSEPIWVHEDGFEMAEMAHDGRRVDEQGETFNARSEAEELDEDTPNDDAPLVGRRKRRRRSSVQSFQLYTPDEERRIRKKLDIGLALFVALLYMMAFLDRSNIGNAKTAGLTKDLYLSGSQFEWLLTAFYITYICFEWMTICYKLFPPHIYISICVFVWGIVASLQSLAGSFGAMLALRALLGIGEAAFVGMPIYLSYFFRRQELAFRTGIFIAAAPLATSFASSLAWVIVRFGDVVPIANWRLLFLLEGFPACLVAVWAFHWLPDSPSQVRWLNERERGIAARRMLRESEKETSSSREALVPRHKRRLRWNEITQTLRDPKSWLTAAMFFCCNVAFSSMPVFLPTIVNQMGNSPLASQGLSAPPNLFAFLVVLITASVSDRIQSRSGPMIFHALLAMSGYLFLALAGLFRFDHTLRYLAVFPICAGFFSAVTIVITWTLNNQTSDEGKSTGLAVLNIIGQMGPLLGTRLYPDTEAPYYASGMSVCAVCMGLVAVLALVLRMVLLRENAAIRRRKANVDGEGLVASTAEDTFMFIT